MAKFDLNDSSVVCIIGSGAGGGTLGNELAQKGIKVVCLEAGPRLKLDDIKNDFLGMFGKLSWLDSREGTGQLDAGLPAWICKVVGGTTVHWAGASLRFQPHEFKALTTYGQIDGANLLDFPITYDDLADYYTKAENKMGTTGTGADQDYQVITTIRYLNMVPEKWVTRKFIPVTCQSIQNHMTVVQSVNKLVTV